MTVYTSDKIKIISFFSIILVVFLHAYNLDNAPELTPLFYKSPTWFIEDIISQGFTRIAVPLFFLLSGFLFFLNTKGTASEFWSKIKKRSRTLLIPFLFWSLFGIAFYFTLQTIPQTAAFFTKEHVANFTFQKWVSTVFINPIPYQFWFIRDLMVLVLASPLLYFCLKKFWQPSLLLAFILWMSVTNEFQNSVEALFFFVSGGCISIQKPEIIETHYRKQAKLFFLIWIVLVVMKSIMVFQDADIMRVTSIYKLSILTGVVGVWGIYDLVFKQKAGNRLLQITGFTFFIYAAHEPMLTVFKKVLFVIFGKGEKSYMLVYVIAPIITIISCIVIGMLLKKYITVGYELITGGR